MPTRRAGVFTAAIAGFLLFITATGCGSDLLGAGLDLHKIKLNGDSVTAGEDAGFVVNYTNRSDITKQFSCELNPNGGKITLTAPPKSEDADIEIGWPGLRPGKYKISCGVIAAKESNIFTINEEFEVKPATLAAEATNASNEEKSFVISKMSIAENQRVWSGKLRVQVNFNNPDRTGGWIRCATSPVTLGDQLAEVVRERSGERIFEFTYPENVSAEYQVWCSPEKSFLKGPAVKSEKFTVGL